MAVSLLPTDKQERKNLPLMSGFFDYFPAAIAEVARVSKIGNDQHNPGQPLHWARNKSSDHLDAALRHLAERGTVDGDGGRHTAKAAWRVMAYLQEEMEDLGAPMARGGRNDEVPEEVSSDVPDSGDGSSGVLIWSESSGDVDPDDCDCTGCSPLCDSPD
jgi:hypothetical protein